MKKNLLTAFAIGAAYSQLSNPHYQRVASSDTFYISPSSPALQLQNSIDPYIPVSPSNYLGSPPPSKGFSYLTDYNQYNNNYEFYNAPSYYPSNQNVPQGHGQFSTQYSQQYSSGQNPYHTGRVGAQYAPSGSSYSNQYGNPAQQIVQYSNINNGYKQNSPNLRSDSSFVRKDQSQRPYNQNYRQYPGNNLYSDEKNYNDYDCLPPRQVIAGICRCPDDGVYVAGSCMSRKTPPPNCYPPRTLINGQCICPNNQIYISQNKCVPNNDQNNKNIEYIVKHEQCKIPRVLTVNKYCLCQNNGVYLNGQCALNLNYKPLQPLYPKNDFDSIAVLGRNFREFNGTNNNQQNDLWGSKGQPLERIARAYYSDRTDQPFHHLPSPRVISNQLCDLGFQSIVRSVSNITALTTFFGQFVDHDLDLIQFATDENLNIQIPQGDKFFKDQSQLRFTRSAFFRLDGVRWHKNLVTSWIDANQVYGSDQQTSKSLRLFSNGKLKSSIDNMLPRQGSGLFLAGDVRANQNVMLSALHTVFMRQHNRVCDQIKLSYPQFSDQQIFRSARQWVIGLLQKITLQQFVPILLGDQYYRVIGRYNGYKPHVKPNIPTEFAAAAYRIGHTLLVDTFSFINKSGITYQNTRLTDLFANPKYINSDKIQDALRGLTKTLQKQKSIKITDQVRNFLILDPTNRQSKLDLVSLNIQRGRDHGLPTYNQARQAFGLPTVSKFEDIQSDFVRAQKLRNVYRNNINDIDLFIGIISEPPVKNGILGQLGCRIVGQTFRNIRDGDRFWYQSAYPKHIVAKIKQTTLADVIRRNTRIRQQIQDDVWHYFDKLF